MTDEVIKRMFAHDDYRREMQIRMLEENQEEEYYVLEGKAVTFNEATVLFRYDGLEYKEIIERNAFNNADMSNVFFKFNHEQSIMALARTKNGTLNLDIRDDGVYVKIKMLRSISASKDLYEAVKAGLIDKMSFAFSIKNEDYNEETRTWTVRDIDRVYDVAAVEFPAYDNTFIYARRKNDVETRLKEVEASRLEIERIKALAKLKF